ncbi:hypothetical protein A1A1_16750 [Planococcus antarcticus DSM 14505]|uniref:Uncharacterized protein n=1 Tax=Planococcus antarcticus DSM 14505 TaxID=1185653 RepID=A0AA87IJH2_9BACL|nr:hypothetical protein [Planococcus antarcticus]EIM05332.1 hypothetical protein A1A1_16750 [Planococcus antarcticus DSM 14505]
MDERIMITLSVKELRTIIREEVEAALEQQPSNKHDLPAILTRLQVMDLMHVSGPTLQKYLEMPGFPIFRKNKLLVETEALLKWIRENSCN